MDAIFAAALKALLAYGSIGVVAAVAMIGWVAAIFLAWRGLKRKDTVSAEVNKIHDKYSKEIGEINKRYSKTIEDIGEKRVQDFKDITDDYHDLATNTLQALDRLVLQLTVRREHTVKGE